MMFGNLFGSGFIDIAMNRQFVFFFNTFNIWHMDITKPEEGFKVLNLLISPSEEMT